MMLFKNDQFLHKGTRHRLLHCEPQSGKAWAISIDDSKAWPQEFAWSFISSLQPHHQGLVIQQPEVDEHGVINTPVSNVPLQSSIRHGIQPTAAMLKVRDNALQLLGDLLTKVPAIFDETQRGTLILERAQQAGCSRPTIYKHLRQFWVGGQTPAALLGNFYRCGRTLPGVTGARGAKTEFGRPVYQLGERDFRNFEEVIKALYLKDCRFKMTQVFQRMLEMFYEVPDGNGDMHILPEGERPTFKQFEYYLRKNYSLTVRLRAREGDKDFERDHRPVLGTVLADCLGVGHYYEADATIADVLLIASAEIQKIIGKPTIYLIIDRKSRLIVGWYVGLENASWVCAMQAFFSISQDKQKLCERLGVKYDPDDWPAHQIFPKEVLADRSELLTNASNQLASELVVTVTNVPAKRPDWKPVVECGFKQTRMILQDGTPGFDPPENAKKRQGRHYEKDACLTLKDFEAIVLLAIIAHNRKPLLDYPLTLKEIGDEVNPVPVELWNHGIVERAGLLTRYSEEHVRMALLPRAEGSVSEEGIIFKDCHYTCPEAEAKGWFVTARKRRFPVKVTFDARLTDTVFVHDPDRAGAVYECKLTPKSKRYAGLSFSEVKAIEKLQRRNEGPLKQTIIQAVANFHKGSNPIAAAALKKLKDANLKVSRTSRRADTKQARMEDLRTERQELAGSCPVQAGVNAKVIALSEGRKALAQKLSPATNPLTVTTELQATDAAPTEPAVPVQAVVVPLTAKEMLAQMKKRMLRG